LDGGVHFAAALRLVLGVPVDSVSCFSRLNKDFLGPVDTVHAAIKLTDGMKGEVEQRDGGGGEPG
jgi:predicted dehydrogenase